MTKEYTLDHDIGETRFETLRDAIMAMYLISDYDKECRTEFERTEIEISRITDMVEQGKYYINGAFTLHISRLIV